MDLLKLFIKKTKQSGEAATIAVITITIAFITGLIFKYITDHVDHPIEQVSEQVLSEYNIDYDFSDEKKEDEQEEAAGK